MNLISKFLEINNKWKRKYNRLCIQFEALANEKIESLKKDNDNLNKLISYRDKIEELETEVKCYRRKYGRLKGGDINDKNKSK